MGVMGVRVRGKVVERDGEILELHVKKRKVSSTRFDSTEMAGGRRTHSVPQLSLFTAQNFAPVWRSSTRMREPSLVLSSFLSFGRPARESPRRGDQGGGGEEVEREEYCGGGEGEQDDEGEEENSAERGTDERR